jgi:hypothetical protein
MLNVHTAESIISLITFLLAYMASVTLAGCFTAWVALKMGDETPEQEGFLTLNPMAHIDFLGTLFIILYNFGWGRFIPINPFNIHGKFRVFKILVAFLAKTIAHWAIGAGALISLIALFGERILVSAAPLAQAFPEASSYTISIGMIFVSLLWVNVMLAVITFILNFCGLAVMVWAEKNPDYLPYTSIIMVIVPIAIFYLVGGWLIKIMFFAITSSGFMIASLLRLF